jgi:hypothetical protein
MKINHCWNAKCNMNFSIVVNFASKSLITIAIDEMSCEESAHGAQLAGGGTQSNQQARTQREREHGAQQQLLNKKLDRKWLSARRFEMSAEEVTVWKIELSVVDPFIIYYMRFRNNAPHQHSQCALPTVFSSALAYSIFINTVAIMRKFDASARVRREM